MWKQKTIPINQKGLVMTNKAIFKLFIIVSVIIIAFCIFSSRSYVQASDTELLTAPWNFVGNNGSSERYQSIPANSLNGKSKLRLTYNLRGHCLLGGDASAIIFDQNGWRYISLSNYGQNCLNGVQTVEIPLSDFPGLNTLGSVGTFHGRIWKLGAYSVDVISAVLIDAVQPTPTPTPQPTATPTSTIVPTPTVTPTPPPAPQPNWDIQGVDVMKYSKDVVCAPPSDEFIASQAAKAKELGVTHVAVATPYENPSCGNSLTLTTKWVNAIRAEGLKVWHRHMPLAHEGIYSTPKHRSPDGHRFLKIITDWITVNRSLIKPGDIFTPIPEPQNGGISGITHCPQICQYSHAAEFNEWIRLAQLTTELAINDPEVKVGYYGFDGFIVWGDNNPDWQGIGFLEAATVTAMDNVIAIDHYPATNTTMAQDLDEAHAKWPQADFVIGEWGTIFQSTDAEREQAVIDSMGASARSYVKGFNYWHLGPGGNEGLINNDNTNRAHFDEVKGFYQ